MKFADEYAHLTGEPLPPWNYAVREGIRYATYIGYPALITENGVEFHPEMVSTVSFLCEKLEFNWRRVTQEFRNLYGIVRTPADLRDLLKEFKAGTIVEVSAPNVIGYSRIRDENSEELIQFMPSGLVEEIREFFVVHHYGDYNKVRPSDDEMLGNAERFSKNFADAYGVLYTPMEIIAAYMYQPVNDDDDDDNDDNDDEEEEDFVWDYNPVHAPVLPSGWYSPPLPKVEYRWASKTSHAQTGTLPIQDQSLDERIVSILAPPGGSLKDVKADPLLNYIYEELRKQKSTENTGPTTSSTAEATSHNDETFEYSPRGRRYNPGDGRVRFVMQPIDVDRANKGVARTHTTQEDAPFGHDYPQPAQFAIYGAAMPEQLSKAREAYRQKLIMKVLLKSRFAQEHFDAEGLRPYASPKSSGLGYEAEGTVNNAPVSNLDTPRRYNQNSFAYNSRHKYMSRGSPLFRTQAPPQAAPYIPEYENHPPVRAQVSERLPYNSFGLFGVPLRQPHENHPPGRVQLPKRLYARFGLPLRQPHTPMQWSPESGVHRQDVPQPSQVSPEDNQNQPCTPMQWSPAAPEFHPSTAGRPSPTHSLVGSSQPSPAHSKHNADTSSTPRRAPPTPRTPAQPPPTHAYSPYHSSPLARNFEPSSPGTPSTPSPHRRSWFYHPDTSPSLSSSYPTTNPNNTLPKGYGLSNIPNTPHSFVHPTANWPQFRPRPANHPDPSLLPTPDRPGPNGLGEPGFEVGEDDFPDTPRENALRRLQRWTEMINPAVLLDMNNAYWEVMRGPPKTEAEKNAEFHAAMSRR